MKIASDLYQQELLEPWRGQWLLNLYIGVIKEIFQATAYSQEKSEISFLSDNFDKFLYNNVKPNEIISTFEKDMFKADGKSVFIDRNHTGIEISYHGLISENISDANGNMDFNISFKSSGGVRGLGGLTLYFMEAYPILFTVECKNKGISVFKKNYTNNDVVFTTSDNFSKEADEMVLTIIKMNKPHIRFRMYHILFGIGVNFTNSDFMIAGGSYQTFMSSRSLELPTQSLNLSIDNFDNKFNFDKSDSLINLMNPGQDMSLQIGYIKQNGEIEYLPKETIELSNFELVDNTLNINGVDFLSNENEVVKFDDPSFFTSTTTLYDVTMKVIESLKSTSFIIKLDDALRSVPMLFHEVEISVKDAIMMIASASRCVMEFTPEGIYLRRKDIRHIAIDSDSETGTPYSDNVVTNTDVITMFSDFEKDRFKANGLSKFPPKEKSNVKTGYVSEAISDAKGLLNEEASFDIYTEEPISPSYFTIEFKDTLVKKITISTYYNDKLLETLEYDNIDSDIFHELHDYIGFNRMNVQINEIKHPNRRVYVNYASFSDYVYTIHKNVIVDRVPKGSLIDNVRDIYVKYSYSSGDEDGRLDIEDVVVVHCNDVGSDIEYENPFVTTKELAKDVAIWLKDYYDVQIEYDFEWVGNPTLEVNDTISIPNDVNNNGVICEIENNTINFSNGGLRGTIIGRRNLNAINNTKNKLGF